MTQELTKASHSALGWSTVRQWSHPLVSGLSFPHSWVGLLALFEPRAVGWPSRRTGAMWLASQREWVIGALMPHVTLIFALGSSLASHPPSLSPFRCVVPILLHIDKFIPSQMSASLSF